MLDLNEEITFVEYRGKFPVSDEHRVREDEVNDFLDITVAPVQLNTRQVRDM